MLLTAGFRTTLFLPCSKLLCVLQELLPLHAFHSAPGRNAAYQLKFHTPVSKSLPGPLQKVCKSVQNSACFVCVGRGPEEGCRERGPSILGHHRATGRRERAQGAGVAKAVPPHSKSGQEISVNLITCQCLPKSAARLRGCTPG